MKKYVRIWMLFVLLLYGVVLTGCGKKSPKPQAEASTDASALTQAGEDIDNPDAEADVSKIEGIEALDGKKDGFYIVLDVDEELKQLTFATPNSTRTVQYSYSEGTKFWDKYGEYTPISEFKKGRVVELGEENASGALKMVQLTDAAWSQAKVNRYEIDLDKQIITIGQTKYSYDDYIRVFSGNSEIAIEQINEMDTLYVQGIDKKIVSIRVTKGHGTLALANTELFEGGWISLGTKIYAVVTENMTLVVPEGTYKLSVANEGYGDTKKIKIKKGRITTVDLNDYKGAGPQICKINFELGIEDAILVIDNQEVDASETIELTYGIHELSIVAPGYDVWKRQLAVHSETATIVIGESELESDGTKTDDSDAENDEDAEDEQDATAEEEEESTDEDDRTERERVESDYLDTLTDLLSSLTSED